LRPKAGPRFGDSESRGEDVRPVIIDVLNGWLGEGKTMKANEYVRRGKPAAKGRYS